MKVIPVRAFRDNYIWMLVHGRHAVAVDPGDASPVQEMLYSNGLELAAILVTHRHNDHIGGINTLLENQSVPVFAPRYPAFDFAHAQVAEGDHIVLPELGLNCRVLEVPGHTAEHVAYYVGNHLFCGDTLFGCGCGRIFDGNPGRFFASLQKIASLPDDTLLYPAHEYTLDNIRFARTLEPENADLALRQEENTAQRAQNLPTLPSTLKLEKATNPFLRCNSVTVRAAAARFNPAMDGSGEAIFSTLREIKNNY